MPPSECCLIKMLPYILFEKYIYMLALEMPSRGNRHCADCVGAQGTGTVPTVYFRSLSPKFASTAGFKCVEALGKIIIRGPYPPSNAIIYMHLQL